MNTNDLRKAILWQAILALLILASLIVLGGLVGFRVVLSHIWLWRSLPALHLHGHMGSLPVLVY